VITESPDGDPIGRAKRRSIAARRVGVGAKCEWCGENRPFALIAGSNPKTCVECMRRQKGHKTIDYHHPVGKANDSTTFRIGANDHADLTEAQRAWPKTTLENPDGSPLLAIAARHRGNSDLIDYLMKKPLLRSAPAIEDVDAFLTSYFGRKWWTKREYRNFMKRRTNK
jgi:hypothetical protein